MKLNYKNNNIQKEAILVNFNIIINQNRGIIIDNNILIDENNNNYFVL